MTVAERRAETTWIGTTVRGSGRLRVGSGAFDEQTLTFAARAEQSDGKTSPEELIAAAHSACFAMALSAGLTRGGHPPEELTVSAVCSLDRVDGALTITTMDLNVRGRVPGVDDATFSEAVRQAEQNCPVSKALRGNVEIRMNASLKA